MTYHYEKTWFLMCLCRWLVVKAQNYPDIWQHTSYVYWYLFAFVPPLCSFSLSAVLQRTSKGKRKNGFEKTLWFGIKLWKDLDGHQGLSLPSLSLFSLSLCQRAGTVLPVLFDTQKSDTLLTCLHMREALWNRKLTSAFLHPKLVPKFWSVASAPCKEITFRNGLGFTCAIFF